MTTSEQYILGYVWNQPETLHWLVSTCWKTPSKTAQLENPTAFTSLGHGCIFRTHQCRFLARGEHSVPSKSSGQLDILDLGGYYMWLFFWFLMVSQLFRKLSGKKKWRISNQHGRAVMIGPKSWRSLPFAVQGLLNLWKFITMSQCRAKRGKLAPSGFAKKFGIRQNC